MYDHQQGMASGATLVFVVYVPSYASSCPPARMISHSLEVEKQRGNETKKVAHARCEPGTLKSLLKSRCNENEKKKIASWNLLRKE